MSERGTASRNQSGRRSTPPFQNTKALDNARQEFAGALRTQISEVERALEALRKELAATGGEPKTRKTQVCSACGRAGHTKRTCQERAKDDGLPLARLAVQNRGDHAAAVTEVAVASLVNQATGR